MSGSGLGSLAINKVDLEKRYKLEKILYNSFEGWYLRHSLRKLYQVKDVFEADLESQPVGLAMLDDLSQDASYVFYIAVLSNFRGRGIGSKLLDFCVNYSAGENKKEIYAAVEGSNQPSIILFTSKGFRKITFAEMVRRFGLAEALEMYRRMVVVPGEMLLVKKLAL